MKSEGLEYLVDRKITGVVAKKSAEAPTSQVFILLEGGTLFEFYGDNIAPSGPRHGGAVWARDYMAGNDRPIVFACLLHAQDRAQIPGATAPPLREHDAGGQVTGEVAQRYIDYLTDQANRLYERRSALIRERERSDLQADMKLEAHTLERARTAFMDILAGRTPADVPERNSWHH